MVISTVSYDQKEIIRNIIDLHCNGLSIECDPTYSKGNFYKDGSIAQPVLKYDLFPKTEETIKSSAENLPIKSSCIRSLMFDPPFVAGHTKSKPTGIIGERFYGFPYIPQLWDWYSLCIKEHHRILKKNGIYIFKCQDTVSSGKQWFSHSFIMNEMEETGFYIKDLFILAAKSRMIGHNHQIQKHARKFHSYFIVAEKKS